MADYLTVPLNSKHRKSEFTCGNIYLDHYIRKQAGQDLKRKLAACFVLADEENGIKGFTHYPMPEFRENLFRRA